MVKLVATKNELVAHVQSKELVVVDFTAKWCGPCRVIAPVFEKLEKENTKITFLKVDIDDFDEIDDYQIQGVPTFLFYKNNVQVDSVVGANAQVLQNTVLRLGK